MVYFSDGARPPIPADLQAMLGSPAGPPLLLLGELLSLLKAYLEGFASILGTQAHMG